MAKVACWPPNSIQLKCSAGMAMVFWLVWLLPVSVSAVAGSGSSSPGVGSSQNVILVPPDAPSAELVLTKSNLSTTQCVWLSIASVLNALTELVLLPQG